MANIHTVRGSQGAMFVDVVAHFTVTGNNVLGVPFSTAVILSGYSSGKTALPYGDGTNGTILPDEAELIALGQRFEFRFQCPLPQNWDALTVPQQQAVIDTEYAKQVTTIQADATAKLSYFGSSFA